MADVSEEGEEGNIAATTSPGQAAGSQSATDRTKASSKSADRPIEVSDTAEMIARAAERILDGRSADGVPEIEAAIREALREAAERAVQSPEIRSAIDQAVQRNRTGFAGLGPSAIDAAVDKALVDVARNVASRPDVAVAIDRALQRNRTGLAGLGPSAIDAAVDKALVDAARSAVSRPDTQVALSRALRDRAARDEFPSDPALELELDKHLSDEPSEGEADNDDGASPKQIFPSAGGYSPRFSSPGDFFAAHEVTINSFASLTREIGALAHKNPALKFVWRGQQDANWGLHSSLYRRLLIHRGLTWDSSDPNEREQAFPDETAMLNAELAVLDEAAEWRMTDLTALELFARLQHHGGPTRLLDVTRNPLIAAWFAVEAGPESDTDGRLFALATAPAPEGGEEQATDDPLLSEILATKRYPFWSEYNSTERRRAAAWGTGTRRRLWVPPAYDARIAAQNAAFLLEGVPMFTSDNLRLFNDAAGNQWSVTDVAASMSIYARPVNPVRKARATKARLAPLFSFRIEANAKAEIREMLNLSYGYTTSLLYPDIQGISNRLRNASDWLNVPNERIS